MGLKSERTEDSSSEDCDQDLDHDDDSLSDEDLQSIDNSAEINSCREDMIIP